MYKLTNWIDWKQSNSNFMRRKTARKFGSAETTFYRALGQCIKNTDKLLYYYFGL